MDPATAAIGAAAISAGADLVGGLIGSKASKNESRNNRRESRRQFNVQDDWNKNFLQYRVKDAIKAGVNPLTAISASGGSYSPTVHTGGGSDSGSIMADTFSRVGDRISRAFESFQRDAVVESTELDLESKRLQNEYLQARIDTLTQPGIVDIGSVGDNDPIAHVVDTNPLVRYDNPWSRVRPVRRLNQKWMMSDGSIVDVINPDAIPDMEADNIEALRVAGNEYPRRGWIRDYFRSRNRYKDSRNWSSRQREYMDSHPFFKWLHKRSY